MLPASNRRSRARSHRIRTTAGPLYRAPGELCREQGFHLALWATEGLRRAYLVPAKTAPPEETTARRWQVLLAVLREALASAQPGSREIEFSFQVRNRPLYRDTVHVWAGMRSGPPLDQPVVVVDLVRYVERD